MSEWNLLVDRGHWIERVAKEEDWMGGISLDISCCNLVMYFGSQKMHTYMP